MKRYIPDEIKSGDPIIKRTARQWFADVMGPKDQAPPSVAHTPPVVVKPSPVKKSIPWGAIRDSFARAPGIDRDGQVLRPDVNQRGTAGLLSMISPRSRD